MVEQIVSLCRQMGAGENDDALLRTLAPVVAAQLRGELRPGVEVEECGEAFLLACALTCMEHLREMTGEGNVRSFTVGEVTIRREGGTAFSKWSRRLLAPWLKDGGFFVMGVEG